jgi:hypothetical protein
MTARRPSGSAPAPYTRTIWYAFQQGVTSPENAESCATTDRVVLVVIVLQLAQVSALA